MPPKNSSTCQILKTGGYLVEPTFAGRPDVKCTRLLLSRGIAREANLMMQFGTMSASQRLAAFLIGLSERFAARGYSRSEFNLRMTRDEIGSYLGMKLETVSRMFSRLQKDGIVELTGKHIRIVDCDQLGKL